MIKSNNSFGLNLISLIFLAVSIIAVLTATIFYLSIESLNKDKAELNNTVTALNEELAKKNSEIASLQKEISDAKRKYNLLNEEYSELEKNKNVCESEKSSLLEEYSGMKNELKNIFSELDEYEKIIAESAEWFRKNSTMPEGIFSSEKAFLKRMCLYESEKRCDISLACLPLVNEKKLNFHYRADLGGSGDKLYSLEDFIKQHGGDCEDYALFFKAEYNYLLDQCNDSNKRINLMMWDDIYSSHGEKVEEFFVDFAEKEWYYYVVKKVFLTGYKYPAVVCGKMYDLQSGEINGHCVVAFTKNKIESADDIYKELNQAIMVEPQTGQFLGYINGDSGIYLNDNNITYPYDQYIFAIITDNDYYIYDAERKPAWQGYEFFYNKIKEKEQQFQEILNRIP